MNYQKIKLVDGPTVEVDLDQKRARCNRCGTLIRFGITRNSKYLPIEEIREYVWQAHFINCKTEGGHVRTDLEKQIDEENKTQKSLNNL